MTVQLRPGSLLGPAGAVAASGPADPPPPPAGDDSQAAPETGTEAGRE